MAIVPCTCIVFADQRGVSRPQNGDCDRGSVEVVAPVNLATLCVNFYTSQVLSPISGQCGVGRWQINLPSAFPLGLCVNAVTGQITYATGGTCAPPRVAHGVLQDGPLLVCWSRYSGALRATTDVARCAFGVETPVLFSVGR